MATLEAKKRIYQALVIRFIIGRYGRDNIGFMWAIVEPMMLCVGVMFIWGMTKGSSYHGLNVVAFVLTGYMPLTLWRHQTGYMINVGKMTKFLTMFHNLTVFDAILAKLFLEFISVSAAFVIVFLALYSFDLIKMPYNLGGVLQGWFAMAALASGAGMLLASLSETTEIVEKINQPVQYFVLPFSGCFFLVSWLPDSVQEYALYIPLVNAYELIRGGFYGPEVETFGSAPYVFFWAIVSAGVGCFIFERVKDRIEA